MKVGFWAFWTRSGLWLQHLSETTSSSARNSQTSVRLDALQRRSQIKRVFAVRLRHASRRGASASRRSRKFAPVPRVVLGLDVPIMVIERVPELFPHLLVTQSRIASTPIEENTNSAADNSKAPAIFSPSTRGKKRFGERHQPRRVHLRQGWFKLEHLASHERRQRECSLCTSPQHRQSGLGWCGSKHGWSPGL